MIHEGKLFSRVGKVKDGDEFVGCNFAQAVPSTAIFADKKGLKFTRCNLARAIVPGDSTIEDCNTSQSPIPPEPEPVEMVEIEAAQLAALRADREELKRLKPKEVDRG